MIVRQFLFWLRDAPAGERAEATAALARAYLYSDLSRDDLAAAEGAMTMLLDDPSPLVRMAMAQALAASDYAPTSVIHALAADQPDIAAIILESSPLLLEAELVDAVATQGPLAQSAIARRARLPRSVAAAIAEVGTAESCLELIENPGADVAPLSLERLVERFGHLAAIRDALLARADLPAAKRQVLLAKLSRMLAELAVNRDWMSEDRAGQIARESCEKVTVSLAASTKDLAPLVQHLRESGQLTTGLILRGLLSGNMPMVEEAFAQLAGTTRERAATLIHDVGRAGLRALYFRAGLPSAAYPVFREAIATIHEDGFLGDLSGTHLKRRMIERVLTRCAAITDEETAPVIVLLRRFATEAAREEARMFCDDLVSEVPLVQPVWQDDALALADDVFDDQYDVMPAYDADVDAAPLVDDAAYAEAAYSEASYQAVYDALALPEIATAAPHDSWQYEIAPGICVAEPVAPMPWAIAERPQPEIDDDIARAHEALAAALALAPSTEVKWDEVKPGEELIPYNNSNEPLSFDDIWDGHRSLTEWDDHRLRHAA